MGPAFVSKYLTQRPEFQAPSGPSCTWVIQGLRWQGTPAAGLAVCWGATLPERPSPIFSSVPNLHSYPLHFSFEDVSLFFLSLLSSPRSNPFLSHLFILSPSFSAVPFLCSHSLLFILSSSPLSSLYYSLSFPPHLFRSSRSPRTREKGRNFRVLAHQEYTNTGFEYFL